TLFSYVRRTSVLPYRLIGFPRQKARRGRDALPTHNHAWCGCCNHLGNRHKALWISIHCDNGCGGIEEAERRSAVRDVNSWKSKCSCKKLGNYLGSFRLLRQHKFVALVIEARCHNYCCVGGAGQRVAQSQGRRPWIIASVAVDGEAAGGIRNNLG